MLAKDFIYERLCALADAFPAIQIKYDFNPRAKTHIVELTPISSYYDDPKLENAWLEIVREFIEEFPAEDLSFISSDSILHIEQPVFSFNGPDMNSVYSVTGIPTFTELWADITNSVVERVKFQRLDPLQQLQFPLVSPEERIWGLFQVHSFDYWNFGDENFAAFRALHETIRDIAVSSGSDTILPDNNTYAMAA